MDKDFLRTHFLFDSFSEEELKSIFKFSIEKKIKEGQMLFNIDERAESFFIVRTGSLRVFSTSSRGTEQTLHVHGSGDVVAEGAMFGLRTYPAYCEAVSDSEVISVRSSDFIDLVMQNPKIAMKLLKSYSGRLREFVSLINRISFQDVKGRFADLLIKGSVQDRAKLVYKMNLSKRELASSLGTIPETLSRTLHFFKREKLIKEDGKRLIILDPEGLRSHII